MMQDQKRSIFLTLPILHKVVIGMVYYLSIVFVILLFFAILKKDVTGTGWDVILFCRAGNTITNGGNPYLVRDLGGGLSWNYLPIYARGFDLLCNHLGFGETYIGWYAIFFLSGMALWLKERSWFYGVVLCATGLFSLGWAIKTGNMSSIEFFFISLAVFLLIRKKFDLSLFALGAVSSIKLLPILYLPLFIGAIPDWKPRIRAAALGLTGFLLPFLISIVWYPTLTVWYFRQVSGAIPGQHSAVAETGGVNTPSLTYMFAKLFSLEVKPMRMVLFSFLLYLLAVIILFYVWKFSGLKHSAMARPEFLIGFGMAFITLFMPRLKPYSYMPALLSFYLLTKESSRSIKSVFLWILSIIPLGAYYATQHDFYFHIPIWVPATLNNAIFTLYEYHQTSFLFISVGLLLYILLKSKPENRASHV